MEWVKKIGIGLGIFLESVSAGVVIFFTIALLFQVFPVGETPDGPITIYVRSNGIHTDILIPKEAAESQTTILETFENRWHWGDYLAYGWGERAFYVEARTWADVGPGTIMGALFWPTESAMHVEICSSNNLVGDVKELHITDKQLQIIVAEINGTLNLRQTKLIPSGGYTHRDEFFTCEGGYNMFTNCNTWVGAVLRKADIKMPAWTPFSFNVLNSL